MTDIQEMELTHIILDLIRLSVSLEASAKTELSKRIEEMANDLVQVQAKLAYETK